MDSTSLGISRQAVACFFFICYVSIRQHTSAYVAYVNIRENTRAYWGFRAKRSLVFFFLEILIIRQDWISRILRQKLSHVQPL